MNKIIINGGHELEGTIKIGGDKNSVVALIPAAILSDEEVTIANVPDISDIDALEEILEYLNAYVERNEDIIKINSKSIVNKEIPESIATKFRASYYFMGALLSKYKKVEIYFPGGCNIGSRPIDQHIKGFKALGATVIEEGNKYTITADKLIGTKITIDMPDKGATTSVGATINIMLAAVKAEGETIIENAAKEPQIVNVATFLNNMGAKIIGAGTSTIKIKGVTKLGSSFNEVIPDRIEAGTYMILASLIGKNVKIENIIPEHNEALINKLKEMGVNIELGRDYAIIKKCDNLKPVNIKTLVYPGFVTDLQQIMTAMLTQANGISIVEETIYENRFQNVKYLNDMGSNIIIEDDKPYCGKLYIHGKTPLKGCEVKATDLRGGASVVVAGLIAEGTTTITNIEHILRGYDKIIQKLTSIGAKITIE